MLTTSLSADFSIARRVPPLWLLVLITFSGTLAMHMFVPALGVAGHDLNVDAASIRITISVYIFGLAVGQLIYGPISDVFGRRPTLLVGLTLYTLGGFVSTIAPNVSVLIGARLVQAAGGCAGLLLGRAIVRETSGSTDAVRRLALMNLMTLIGPGFAPLCGGLIASAFGWRAIFVVLTSLGVLNFIVSWRLLPETGTPNGSISFQGVARDYRTLLRSPRFVGLVLGGGCSTTAVYGFLAASPFIFVNELHRPVHEVGIYVGLVMAGISIGNIVAGRLIGRVHLEKLLLAGNVLSLVFAAIFVPVVMLHPTTWTITTIICLYCVGGGIVSPAVSTLSISVDPRLIGSAAGLYGFMQMTVGAICTSLAGIGHDPAVSVSVVLLGAALLAMLSYRIALRHPATHAF